MNNKRKIYPVTNFILGVGSGVMIVCGIIILIHPNFFRDTSGNPIKHGVAIAMVVIASLVIIFTLIFSCCYDLKNHQLKENAFTFKKTSLSDASHDNTFSNNTAINHGKEEKEILGSAL